MATDIQAILQQLRTGATQALDPTQVKQAMAPVTDLLTQSGGLAGVVERLRDNGLSEQVNSWLGQGANLAATPEQIMAALGPDQLKATAERAGTSAQELAAQLSATLPVLVDKVSPAGQLPGVANVQEVLAKLPGSERVSGLLSQVLGGSTPPPSSEA